MHFRFSILLLCVSLSIAGKEEAHGQEEKPASKFEIHRIRFAGNEAFDSGQLGEVILSKETSVFISRFLYNIFGEKLGRKPEYFDPGVLRTDIARLKVFYQNQGYFDAVVLDSLAFDTAGAAVDIGFLIRENRRSLVDSLEYLGLSHLPRELMEIVFNEPLVGIGKAYQKHRVNGEIDRVLKVLENAGYANARFDRENSAVTRYLSTNNVRVVLSFITGQQRQFGNVTITVSPPREDITEDIVLKQLDFEPGELYSREKRISSERNLNRLGVFESARVDAAPSLQADTIGAVPVQVTVRPRDKHEVSPELTVSDENNAFNLGLGIGYTNRNFFGDARNFNAVLRLRTQSIQEWDFGGLFGGAGLRDASVRGAIELQFHLAQPYFFTRKLSGSWTFSLSAEKQKAFILPVIRNKMGLSNQFAPYMYGFLEWTLERVSVEFLQDTADAQIALGRRREEERPQFNSILSLTLQRDKTNDIFSPSDGLFQSLTVEESGVLPELLSTLQPALPFTQFYKVSLIERWYQDLSRTKYSILAMKFRTGYQDKYGDSRKSSSIRIPLNRRFFAGGSGSVRGWISRDLGAMPDAERELGGNFILEGSVEMRMNHFRGFGKLLFLNLDYIWLVYFLDAGNVWSDLNTFRSADIALAAGMGFRYETLFGPIRVDFGFRLYNPREPNGRQWFFQKRIVGDVLGAGVLHFGVGHAF